MTPYTTRIYAVEKQWSKNVCEFILLSKELLLSSKSNAWPHQLAKFHLLPRLHSPRYYYCVLLWFIIKHCNSLFFFIISGIIYALVCLKDAVDAIFWAKANKMVNATTSPNDRWRDHQIGGFMCADMLVRLLMLYVCVCVCFAMETPFIHFDLTN